MATRKRRAKRARGAAITRGARPRSRLTAAQFVKGLEASFKLLQGKITDKKKYELWIDTEGGGRPLKRLPPIIREKKKIEREIPPGLTRKEQVAIGKLLERYAGVVIIDG